MDKLKNMMDYIKKRSVSVQKEIGDLAEVTTIQSGIQCRITDLNFCINFYYGKRGPKMHRTDDNSSKKFAMGQEGLEVKNIIAIKRAVIEANKAKPKITELTDKGTDACIDHVKQKLSKYKIEYPQPNGQETQAMVVMQSLIVEFEQFR